LVFAGIGAFFLTLDLSMGVTRFFFSSVSRGSRPRLFWLAEAGNVLLIVGGLLFAAYGAWNAYIATLYH
jgi:hypothetical protein